MAENGTEAPRIPQIHHGKDRDFQKCTVRIISQNQQGPRAGHYLKIDPEHLKLTADGNKSNEEENIDFNVYQTAGADSDAAEFVILESPPNTGKVIAIENNQVVVKEFEKDYIKSLDTWAKVNDNNLMHIVFKKITNAGSDYCYFRSALDDSKDRNEEGIILGFDGEGKVMNPTTVKLFSQQAKFVIVPTY